MSTTKQSAIAWTHWTWNMWRGCTKVNEACQFCYADQLSARNPKSLGVWGNDGVRVLGAESYWNLPHKWNETAKATGQRMRVFCASMADWAEDWQGPMTRTDGTKSSITMDMCRSRLFDTIDETPHLDWLLLTKRPENIRRFWPGGYRSNVWRGTSIGLQKHADKMIYPLIETNDLSPVAFLSCEPLLGEVDFGNDFWESSRRVEWVILGCESRGKSAGRFADGYETAAKSINSQCRAAGVPVFNKQMPVNGKVSHNPSEWPEELQAQEFPR